MKTLFNTQADGGPVSYTIFIPLLFIVLLKPIATALTLASGGDGGVFAPSLFIGAFLGLLTAMVANNFLHGNVIPINFIVAGMGAVLSASLHAPFTAIFLVCGITGNYVLLVPLTITCLVSRLTAKLILPYTVYTYQTKA